MSVFAPNSYRAQGEFGLLRTLDIVSYSTEGVVTGKKLPAGGEKVGVLGRFKDAVAISPLILMQAKQEIDMLKTHIIDDMQSAFEGYLFKVDEELEVLGQGSSEALWQLGTVEEPLYVCVTPWLRDFNSDLTRKLTTLRQSHILLVIPHQSKRSIIEVLNEVPNLSTTYNSGENSIGILNPFEKPVKCENLVGKRHPLIDAILQSISGKASTEIKIVPPKPPKIKPTQIEPEPPKSPNKPKNVLSVLLGTSDNEEIEKELKKKPENKKVFISYVRNNADEIDKICKVLNKNNIEYWLDKEDIEPGKFWKLAIKNAISSGAYFLACFSKEFEKRTETYMNEELLGAMEILRTKPYDSGWFIPIKLSECKIPQINLGAGNTSKDIQCLKVYEDWDNEIKKLIDFIKRESTSS